MSNVTAGVIRGQLLHLEEHIKAKQAIYERYSEGLKDLPARMNPYDREHTQPNFWLSCLLIEEEAMCRQVRGETEALYIRERGKTCPTEILEALECCNAEGRPIWKPMHMQGQTPISKEMRQRTWGRIFSEGGCACPAISR